MKILGLFLAVALLAGCQGEQGSTTPDVTHILQFCEEDRNKQSAIHATNNCTKGNKTELPAEEAEEAEE